MSSKDANARRRYGTGSLIVRNGTYFGKWRSNGRQVWRKLGPVRTEGRRDGLTRVQAEERLREAMLAARSEPQIRERVTVGEAGRLLIDRLAALGRKKATLESYESILRVHLAPAFGSRPLSTITVDDVDNFVAASRAAGHAPKSTLNYLGVLHSVFDYGLRRGWLSSNPCKLVDKPRAADSDADLRFLDVEELDALIAAVPDDDVGRVERVLYLAAAMTGMRQGELIALRWLDVDWGAGRIRVRRSFVRGEFGSPKSKRSVRAVPLGDVLGGELDRLYRGAARQRDVDLVFGHPHSGKPMDRSKLLKRFKGALNRAGVREVRFHDLRHTFATRMAAQGVPMRTLQELMGHRDFKTTLIYADYAPSNNEIEFVNAAFGARNEVLNPWTSPARPLVNQGADVIGG